MPSINRRLDILENDKSLTKRRLLALEKQVDVLEKQYNGVVQHIEAMHHTQQILSDHMTKAVERMQEDNDAS